MSAKTLVSGGAGADRIYYNSSKSSAALGVNDLTADNVADKALAAFAFDPTTGKKKSVVSSGMGAGSGEIVASAVSKSDFIQFVRGTATEPVVGIPLQVRGIKRITLTNWTLPVREIWCIGWNGVTGSLNLPTIAAKSESVVRTSKILFGTNERDRTSYSSVLNVSEDAYTVASKSCITINGNPVPTHVADVVVKATLSAYTNTTGTSTLALVKGSKTATLSVSWAAGAASLSLSIGDVVAIQNAQYNVSTPAYVNNAVGTTAVTIANNIAYKIVNIVGTTITLDREYTGETQTLTNANIITNFMLMKATAITEAGIRLVGKVDNENYGISADGVLEMATVLKVVDGQSGTGNPAQVAYLEKEGLAYRGAFQTLDARITNPKAMADTAATAKFDYITIEGRNEKGLDGALTPVAQDVVQHLIIPDAAYLTNAAADMITPISDVLAQLTGLTVGVIAASYPATGYWIV
jgi:hypothetical protein